MKKLLSLILVTVLCVLALASCDTVKGWFDKGEETPGDNIEYNLPAAVEYIRTMYIDDATVTASDYKLLAQVMVKAVKYTVDWSVDSDEIKLTKGVNDEGHDEWTVDVPDESKADIAYKLTATITAGDGSKDTVSFDRQVPKFALNTWEEYMAAKQNDNLVVEGIVVAISSKSTGAKRNHLFLMDKTGVGGYYNYDMPEDPIADLGIEVGMTVRITGPAAPFSGMMEIKKGSAKIINSEKTAFAPVDITDKFIKDANFNTFVALPVVIKGVILGGQDLANANSQYLYFTVNGVESYVRTYVTDFPSTLVEADKATIDNLHAAKQGFEADVTGILVTYNGKTPYLIPTSVDCFYDFRLPTLDEEGEINHEVNKLPVADCYIANGEVVLPTVGADYPDVSFTWSVADDNLAFDAETNKLTITVPANANTTATISYVAKSGETTKEGTVKIALIDPSNNANKIAAAVYGNKFEGVTLNGVIISVDTPYDSNYKNATYTIAVSDANGATVQLYRAKIGENSEINLANVAVGDTVTVSGKLLSYNSKPQLDAGCIISAVKTNADTLAEYKNLASGSSFVGALTGKVAEITSAYSEKFGNITLKIKVGDEIVYCYRIVGEKASVVAAGDTITVLGTIENGEYGKQFTQNSIIVAYTEGTVYVPSTVTSPVVDTPYVLYLVQLNLGKVLYAKGEMSNNYFALTESAADAVPVYLEAVEGGYKLYFVEGEGESAVKKYFDIYNYGSGIGVTIRTDATAVYTIDTKTNTLVANVEGTDYTFGTSGTYNTISKQNTGKTTVFYAHLGTYKVEDEAADADKAALVKDFLKLDKTNYSANATVVLPTDSGYKNVSITWTVNGVAATELAIVVGDVAQEIKLVATIKSGEVELTKEFTVTVDSKADIEKAALNITTNFNADGTLELPTAGATYTDVVISWADAEGNAVTGPITITQTNEEQVIVLIATIVSGETSVTKEFNVKVTAAGAKQWTLVTDASTLKAGDQIIIVAKGYDKALGETQNNNNRASVDVTKSGNTVIIDENVEILELGGSAGAWTLKADEGYLYAASTSSNHLKSQTTNNNKGEWTIAISTDGVATIKSVGNTSRGWMRYNDAANNGNLFSCYGSNQTDICIYILK